MGSSLSVTNLNVFSPAPVAVPFPTIYIGLVQYCRPFSAQFDRFWSAYCTATNTVLSPGFPYDWLYLVPFANPPVRLYGASTVQVNGVLTGELMYSPLTLFAGHCCQRLWRTDLSRGLSSHQYLARCRCYHQPSNYVTVTLTCATTDKDPYRRMSA